jgi:hypothetical protein
MATRYFCDKCNKELYDSGVKIINQYFGQVLCGECYNEYFAIVHNWLLKKKVSDNDECR